MEMELKSLWKTVFGDTDDYIERFFDTFYSPELCAVCKCGGKTAAAAYLMPVGDFVSAIGERVSCAHIYAVGVLPEYRGIGLGKAVTEKCARLGEKNGFGAVVLHPAEEGLFRFYEALGFYSAFSCGERTAIGAGERFLINPEEYRALREEYLEGIPHIDLNMRALRYFEGQGGEFYRGENFCLAMEDGSVKECLYPGFFAPENGRPFGMSYGKKICTDGWLGLAFD